MRLIIRLVNVFTYCAVEENKQRELVVGLLAAAPVPFVPAPSLLGPSLLASLWIGWNPIDQIHLFGQIGLRRGERIDSVPVSTERNVQTKQCCIYIEFYFNTYFLSISTSIRCFRQTLSLQIVAGFEKKEKENWSCIHVDKIPVRRQKHCLRIMPSPSAQSGLHVLTHL